MDKRCERGFIDRTARPRVDADIDHPATLTPTFVNVTVKEPRSLINGALLDEPVMIMAVALIREVAREDSMVADSDLGLTLVDLREAGCEVSLCPTLRSLPMPRPAPVVVAGEQQLASVEDRHE